MTGCPIPAEKAAPVFYRRAYRLFGGRTPIPADCGRLCSSKCCQGGEEDGMILFPFEELALARADFLTITKQRMGTQRVAFAVCPGHCDRALRPLSCRLYPFAPMLEKGRVRIVPDPRAAYFCPLLQKEAGPYLDKAFPSAAARAVESLRTLPGFDAFLMDYGHMLKEYAAFTGEIL